jgi:hypothetical protein
MRSTLVLTACLASFLGACSSKEGSVPPPPLPNKEWLTGKWKNIADAQFLASYEFDKDGVARVIFRGMKEAIPGRYTWSSERTVDLEFLKTSDVQQAYESAVKVYKQEVKDRIKKRELDGRAGPSLLALAADKLPDKQTFTVGIIDPKVLVLTPKDGMSQNLEKEN